MSEEPVEYVDAPWIEQFDERQKALILSCRQYVGMGAPGLPGHQLMLIVDKMAVMLQASKSVFPVEKKPA